MLSLCLRLSASVFESREAVYLETWARNNLPYLLHDVHAYSYFHVSLPYIPLR
jgi:hypothetical protein